MTFIHRAERVKRWIGRVKEKYLDTASTKCIGLDCEFTIVKPGSHKDLPLQRRHRTNVLQLRVASEVLVFQIVHMEAVPDALNFCSF
jgi:hypothetical protein